ncbi:AAA family ATPase [Kitasatospora sp. LaBMicrA B282]|uniref:AAA family ATPase n=1 Tax=Kitasatospora sp. LaBMicrA B282 TaxID=3420949 RepID=UPI003D0C8EAA
MPGDTDVPSGEQETPIHPGAELGTRAPESAQPSAAPTRTDEPGDTDVPSGEQQAAARQDTAPGTHATTYPGTPRERESALPGATPPRICGPGGTGTPSGEPQTPVHPGTTRRAHTTTHLGTPAAHAPSAPSPAQPPTAPSPAPLLAERDGEIAVLREALDRLGRGRSGRITVTGQPGAGRTALLRATARLAEAAGLTARWAQGAVAEVNLPYGVLRQWFPAGGPAGRRLWGDPAQPVPPEHGELAARLGRELRSAARREPLVLLLDDAQWADRASRRVLATLARRGPDGPPILLVIADSGLPAVLDEVPVLPGTEDPRCAQDLLTPAPLTAAGVTRVLAAHWAEPPTERDGAAVAAATRGNPALLAGVLRLAVGGGVRPGAGDPALLERLAGAALAEQVARLLDGAPAELARLLRVVAVCGGALDFALVCTLSEVRSISTATARELLAASGLTSTAERPRLLDPAAAAPVLATLPPAERAALHARAAELGHRLAVPAEDLGRMLLGTPALGDPWAVAALRDAAAQQRFAGRPAAAAVLLRRALDEPLTELQRGQLLLELGRTEAAVAPAVADRRLGRVVRLTGPALAPLRLAAADLLITHGATPVGWQPQTEAERAGHAALTPLTAALPGPWPGRLEERGRHGEHGEHGDHGDHGEACAAAVPTPAPASTPATGTLSPAAAGSAAWQAAIQGESLLRARELARIALAVPSSVAPLFAPRLAACRALLIADEPAGARDGLDAVLVDARRQEASGVAGRALLLRAELELRLGRVDEAERGLARALRAVPRDHWHPALAPTVPGLEIMIALWHGRPDLAEQAAAVPPPAGGEAGTAWAFWLFAQGVLRAAADDPAGALGLFQECGRRLLAQGWANPALLPWRSCAAAALRQLERPDAAAELARRELVLARRWGTAAGVGLARLAVGHSAAAGPALDELDRGVRLLRHSPAQLSYCHGLIELAAARLRAGQQACAEALLREAEELAGVLGAAALAQRARQVSGRAAPASGLASLAAPDPTPRPTVPHPRFRLPNTR